MKYELVYAVGHDVIDGALVTDGCLRVMGIRCLACGLVSHNPHDVEQRYCGRCHVFMDD